MSRWTVVFGYDSGSLAEMVIVEAPSARDAEVRALEVTGRDPVGIAAIIDGCHDDALRHVRPLDHKGVTHADPVKVANGVLEPKP